MIIRSSDKDNSHLRAVNKTEQTAGTKLIETRPLLPPDMWSGKAAEAYRLAAEIPQVVDAQYCYCDCSKNPKFMHKTLLTCYTGDMVQTVIYARTRYSHPMTFIKKDIQFLT